MTAVQRLYLWGQAGGIPNSVIVMRGSGSTTAATTSSVSFGKLPNSTYYLSITPTSGGGAVSSISKTTTGFTITWTASVTNTYDWILTR